MEIIQIKILLLIFASNKIESWYRIQRIYDYRHHYTNGPIHGHLVFMPTYSRYLIARKRRFVCLKWRHGMAISWKPKKSYTTEVIDKYVLSANRSLILEFRLIIFRTSAKIHHDTASEFLENCMNKGIL
jgi:methionyl-tRNA synthetase